MQANLTQERIMQETRLSMLKGVLANDGYYGPTLHDSVRERAEARVEEIEASLFEEDMGNAVLEATTCRLPNCMGNTIDVGGTQGYCVKCFCRLAGGVFAEARAE